MTMKKSSYPSGAPVIFRASMRRHTARKATEKKAMLMPDIADPLSSDQ